MAHPKLNYTLIIGMLLVVGQVNCEFMSGFERCDNSGTRVLNLFVRSCPRDVTSSPCRLKQGQLVDFQFDFIPVKGFDLVETHMAVANYGSTLDACEDGLMCPVKPNQWHSFRQAVPLEKAASPRALDIMQFELTDTGTKEVLVCIKFPVSIEAAASDGVQPTQQANGAMPLNQINVAVPSKQNNGAVPTMQQANGAIPQQLTGTFVLDGLTPGTNPANPLAQILTGRFQLNL